MRPHLFLSAEKSCELRSLKEVREALKSGHAAQLWSTIREQAERNLTAPPFTPSTEVPNRNPAMARLANTDDTICNLAGRRILNAALAHLITGQSTFRDDALLQLK